MRRARSGLRTWASTGSTFGGQWPPGTLSPNDPPAKAVAERWEQFTQYLCLSLSPGAGSHRLVAPAAEADLDGPPPWDPQGTRRFGGTGIDTPGPRRCRGHANPRRPARAADIDQRPRRTRHEKAAPRRGSTGYCANSTTRRPTSRSRSSTQTHARPRRLPSPSTGKIRHASPTRRIPSASPDPSVLTHTRAMGRRARPCGGLIRPGDECSDRRVLRRPRAETQVLATQSTQAPNRGRRRRGSRGGRADDRAGLVGRQVGGGFRPGQRGGRDRFAARRITSADLARIRVPPSLRGRRSGSAARQCWAGTRVALVVRSGREAGIATQAPPYHRNRAPPRRRRGRPLLGDRPTMSPTGPDRHAAKSRSRDSASAS